MLVQIFVKHFTHMVKLTLSQDLPIALKECAESEYWLELLLESSYTENEVVLDHCLEVKKILIASINTAKNNK